MGSEGPAADGCSLINRVATPFDGSVYYTSSDGRDVFPEPAYFASSSQGLDRHFRHGRRLPVSKLIAGRGGVEADDK